MVSSSVGKRNILPRRAFTVTPQTPAVYSHLAELWIVQPWSDFPAQGQCDDPCEAFPDGSQEDRRQPGSNPCERKVGKPPKCLRAWPRPDSPCSSPAPAARRARTRGQARVRPGSHGASARLPCAWRGGPEPRCSCSSPTLAFRPLGARKRQRGALSRPRVDVAVAVAEGTGDDESAHARSTRAAPASRRSEPPRWLRAERSVGAPRAARRSRRARQTPVHVQAGHGRRCSWFLIAARARIFGFSQLDRHGSRGLGSPHAAFRRGITLYQDEGVQPQESGSDREGLRVGADSSEGSARGVFSSLGITPGRGPRFRAESQRASRPGDPPTNAFDTILGQQRAAQ
jgi:hypothetical protein